VVPPLFEGSNGHIRVVARPGRRVGDGDYPISRIADASIPLAALSARSRIRLL
jgi:hypothetical protein